MLSLLKLWSALGTLAEHVAALGQTVGEINSGLRQRCNLDALPVPELPQIEADEPANGRGRKARN